MEYISLQQFFARHPRAALGFSGGVDSSFLLWAGLRYGAQVGAYYVSTPFQPSFEKEDALRLAASLGIRPAILEVDILACEKVAENPPDRCYFCKKKIFQAVASQARKDGYEVLLDGTNASDEASDRPGMRALQELSVLSPLRLCGLTKEEIRRQSREAGLFTWNKPAYACLATRTLTGERITEQILRRTEDAESALHALGLRDFRIRHRGGEARVEVTQSQMDLLFEHRAQITEILLRSGYQSAQLCETPRTPSR